MNIELLYYLKLMDHNYEHIDKLFIYIRTINNEFIDIKSKHYDSLIKIGKSKIVFVFRHSITRNPRKIPKNAITIKQCDFPIMSKKNNYIYENYNFIYGQYLFNIIPFLKIDKINIIIDSIQYYNQFWNDNIRLKSDAFIDIIIEPVHKGHQSISVINGITLVKEIDGEKLSYLQIVGNQVYLKHLN